MIKSITGAVIAAWVLGNGWLWVNENLFGPLEFPMVVLRGIVSFLVFIAVVSLLLLFVNVCISLAETGRRRAILAHRQQVARTTNCYQSATCNCWLCIHKNSDARSLNLLLDYLSSEQRADLYKKGRFAATGNKTKRTYTINYGSQQNITCGAKKYCIVASGIEIPTYDLMLMQKMLIETNEDYFLSTARVSGTP